MSQYNIPGPFGHKIRIRILITSCKVSADDIKNTDGLTLISENNGVKIVDYSFRSMKKGDDETIVWGLNHSMYIWFGIEGGWGIDWDKSEY